VELYAKFQDLFRARDPLLFAGKLLQSVDPAYLASPSPLRSCPDGTYRHECPQGPGAPSNHQFVLGIGIGAAVGAILGLVGCVFYSHVKKVDRAEDLARAGLLAKGNTAVGTVPTPRALTPMGSSKTDPLLMPHREQQFSVGSPIQPSPRVASGLIKQSSRTVRVY